METLRGGYGNELEIIQRDILKMGELSIQALQKSVEALVELDLLKAEEVVMEDHAINQLETDIEQHCVLMIARQQPLARDLRLLMTGLKITTDLERIGDYACDIAEMVRRIMPRKAHIKPLVDIPKMAVKAQEMVQDALKAYHERDLALAQKSFKDDDVVDEFYRKIYDEILTMVDTQPVSAADAFYLIQAAKCLERVADHATNIAEWVVYLETGERVRAN